MIIKVEEKIEKIDKKNIPSLLKEIPHPPKELWIKGKIPPPDFFYLGVIGTRKYSSYGKEACEKIIEGLKGYNFVIISGMAIGIDSISHEVALKNNLKTIAVPGSGLDSSVLYPSINKPLAQRIIKNGGCLISEFSPKTPAAPYTFPMRNRIIAGLSQAILIIEAPKKSGALITAKFAIDFNRDVLAVPGSIFNENSYGTNLLIKRGAYPITSSEDVLEIFNIDKTKKENISPQNSLSFLEEKILSFLSEPLSKVELIKNLKIEISEFNYLIIMMQIKGLIKESGGQIYKI